MEATTMSKTTSKAAGNEPIKVVDRLQSLEVVRKLNGNISKLNEAVEALKGIDDFFPTGSVEELQTISPEWLAGYVSDVKKSIRDDMRFPRGMRDELLKRWDNVKEKAEGYCRTIQMVATWKGVSLKRSADGRYYYDAKDMKTFAEKEAQVTIEGEEGEYLSLLSSLADKLNEASKWEIEHGYLPISSEGVNVGIGENLRTMNLQEALLNDDGRGYSITPVRYIDMKNRGIFGKSDI